MPHVVLMMVLVLSPRAFVCIRSRFSSFFSVYVCVTANVDCHYAHRCILTKCLSVKGDPVEKSSHIQFSTLKKNWILLSCDLVVNCSARFLSHWESAELLFCSEGLSFLPCKNQNKCLIFSFGLKTHNDVMKKLIYDELSVFLCLAVKPEKCDWHTCSQ